jgi:hypothetical protein
MVVDSGIAQSGRSPEAIWQAVLDTCMTDEFQLVAGSIRCQQ